MNLRRGPTQGPTPNPGGAAPSGSLPGNPAAADPGNILMAAISQRMDQAKRSNVDFATSTLDQLLRVISTMQVHTQQMLPDAGTDLNRAWAALNSAKKKFNDAIKEKGPKIGPSLGFSGSSIGPSQANPIPGNTGGPMGAPS